VSLQPSEWSGVTPIISIYPIGIAWKNLMPGEDRKIIAFRKVSGNSGNSFDEIEISFTKQLTQTADQFMPFASVTLPFLKYYFS
jgi:hypothetical protein